MKKKNAQRPLNTKERPKTIPKSIVNKLGMLIGFIVPIAFFISYSMNVSFFSITKIISVIVLIISIAAYLKGEIIYSSSKTVHQGKAIGNKNTSVNKKHSSKFSISLSKGTVQVVLSILIIIVCTYLGQVIYTAIG